MEPNQIRAIVFLIAGLISILFPEQIVKFRIFKRNQDLSQQVYALRIIGFIFILISIVLYLYSVYN